MLLDLAMGVELAMELVLWHLDIMARIIQDHNPVFMYITNLYSNTP